MKVVDYEAILLLHVLYVMPYILDQNITQMPFRCTKPRKEKLGLSILFLLPLLAMHTAVIIQCFTASSYTAVGITRVMHKTKWL